MHQLYQDLFLTDLKSEVASAVQEAAQYRQAKTELESRLRDLAKENSALKASLRRYRKTIADQERKISELGQALEQAQRGTGFFTVKLGDQSASSFCTDHS